MPAKPRHRATPPTIGADDDYYCRHVAKQWLHLWQRIRAPSSSGDTRAALSCTPLPYAYLPGEAPSSSDAIASATTSRTAVETQHQRNRSLSPWRPKHRPSRQLVRSSNAMPSSSCGVSHSEAMPTVRGVSTTASSSSTTEPVIAVIFPQPPPEFTISPVHEAVKCVGYDVGASAFCC